MQMGYALPRFFFTDKLGGLMISLSRYIRSFFNVQREVLVLSDSISFENVVLKFDSCNLNFS